MNSVESNLEIVPAAGRLATTSATEIAVANALYARPVIESAELRWRWELCEPSRTVFAAELRADDQSAVQLSLLTDVVGLPTVDFDWRIFVGGLRAAAWVATYDAFFALLCAALGTDFTVARVADAASLDEPLTHDSQKEIRLGFSVSRSGDLPVCSGLIHCSHSFAQRILAVQRRAPLLGAWSATPARVRCVLDEFDVSQDELKQLETGAVVMLGNPSLTGRQPQMQLSIGALHCSANIEGSNLKVVRGFAANNNGSDFNDE